MCTYLRTNTQFILWTNLDNTLERPRCRIFRTRSGWTQAIYRDDGQIHFIAFMPRILPYCWYVSGSSVRSAVDAVILRNLPASVTQTGERWIPRLTGVGIRTRFEPLRRSLFASDGYSLRSVATWSRRAARPVSAGEWHGKVQTLVLNSAICPKFPDWVVEVRTLRNTPRLTWLLISDIPNIRTAHL